MPYNMNLLQDGQALVVHTGDTVTMGEFEEINERIMTYSRQSSGMMHLIVDMLNTNKHPNNVIELKHSVHWTREPNIGWVIYLSRNRYLNILLDTMMSMHGRSYLVLDDFDAAMSIVTSEPRLDD